MPSPMPMARKLPLILIGRQWVIYETAKFCPKLLRPFCSRYVAWKLRMKHTTIKFHLQFIWFANGEFNPFLSALSLTRDALTEVQ
jgi:hypothetical protein